jgi:hypothetical protein
VVAGSNQTAAVNTSFAAVLQAQALDLQRATSWLDRP